MQHLRILQRAHWNVAISGLSSPVSSLTARAVAISRFCHLSWWCLSPNSVLITPRLRCLKSRCNNHCNSHQRITPPVSSSVTPAPTLLENNGNLNTLYVLKEQLQTLWSATSYESMAEQLESWCQIADQSNMLYLKKFAKSLRKHCVGICNYAKHKLTSARIEAGNVSIGMIRKRARGIRDTEYFKLKIRQSSLPDKDSMFYIAA